MSTTTADPNHNIPLAIFTKICEHLPPSDLLTLTGVCKRFRGFLCSPKSPITQDIWRASRIKFLQDLQLPPPEEMCEEEYVRFGKLLKHCQFCSTKDSVKIYWQFRVRCCQECLVKNTIPIIYSKDHAWMKDKVLEGLVYVRIDNKVLFWTADVKRSFKEFEKISGSQFDDWVEDRKEDRINIMEEAAQRELIEEERKQRDVVSAVNALRVDVDPRQFALSPIHTGGTSSAVSAL